MENRFKRLRYEDDLCLHKKYTMDELAAKMPISKATISHLEASDDYDARISVIKEYKKLFPDVSYDYLLGGKNTMSKEYSHIEEVLPFNNDFYTNLEQLFKTESNPDVEPELQEQFLSYEKEQHEKIECMLNSMVSNPNYLSYFLESIYDALFHMYIQKNTSTKNRAIRLDAGDEDLFKITQATIRLMQDVVFPSLSEKFKADKKVADEQQKATDKKTQDYYGFDDNTPLPF